MMSAHLAVSQMVLGVFHGIARSNLVDTSDFNLRIFFKIGKLSFKSLITDAYYDSNRRSYYVVWS